MKFILVIYIFAGAWAKGDSVAVQAVPMPTQQVCEAAGRQAETLVKGSAKEYRYACLKAD
jgi:hypothetical protein